MQEKLLLVSISAICELLSGMGVKVKEIEAETEMEIDNSRKSNQARQKVADELAKRLREIKRSHSQSNQQGGSSQFMMMT